MTDNYFIILELDPKNANFSMVQDKIREKKILWSRRINQGSPKQRRSAEKLLSLVPDMEAKLSNPKIFEKIADEARTIISQKDIEAIADLNMYLSDLGQENEITEETITRLEKATGLSHSHVVKALKERGMQVASKATKQARHTSRPKLESTIAAEIQDILRYLNIKSLYEFLQLSSDSSLKALISAADKMDRELRRKAHSPEVSSRLELLGHCRSAFKDEISREKYDNSYEVQVLESLNKRLEILGGNQGRLNNKAKDTIISAARELGVNKELAHRYIDDYASARGWFIQSGLSESLKNRKCGFCKTIARAPGRQTLPLMRARTDTGLPQLSNPNAY